MDDVFLWVSDRLHEILGLSDKHTAEYFVGLAKSSSSSQQFVEKLQKTGAVSISPSVITFANELWTKVPHKQQREKPAREKERQIMREQERNRQYKLLSDSEDDESIQLQSKAPRKKKGTKRSKDKRRHLRTQKVLEVESEEEEEKANQNSSDTDEWERYVSFLLITD